MSQLDIEALVNSAQCPTRVESSVATRNQGLREDPRLRDACLDRASPASQAHGCGRARSQLAPEGRRTRGAHETPGGCGKLGALSEGFKNIQNISINENDINKLLNCY